MTALVVCIGCDTKDDGKPAAEGPSAPSAATLPSLSGAEVCKLFVAVPTPPHIVTIAASATESAIEPTADGTGMKAQVFELRAESGPVENGQRRIDGITVIRELVLKHDGTTWSIASDKSTSRSEIFYVHKTADHNPRKLFGAQVIDRYGPKGGTPCELPPPPAEPSASGAEICAAFLASADAKQHELLAVTAAPGFTAPEVKGEKDPPALADGQAPATIRQLRIEDGAKLVTTTDNFVLAKEGATWQVARSQLVFRGEIASGSAAALRDAELVARNKPGRGTACELPK